MDIRQTGSCGVEIGQTIAQRLGIKCYDRELLTMAAKESGYTPQLFERHDEKPANSLIYSMAMGAYPYGPGAYGATEMPLDHKLFLAQFDTIRKIAEKESCVIVGRCANYALEENPNMMSVFILITRTDKKRASYYNYYASTRWGDASSYDLVLSSSVFGVDGCTDIIIDALQNMKKRV